MKPKPEVHRFYRARADYGKVVIEHANFVRTKKVWRAVTPTGLTFSCRTVFPGDKEPGAKTKAEALQDLREQLRKHRAHLIEETRDVVERIESVTRLIDARVGEQP